MSLQRKTPETSTVQLVISRLAARILPAAVIHNWLSARRAGTNRRRRTPILAAAGAAVTAVALAAAPPPSRACPP